MFKRLILELSRNDILKGRDPNFIHHSEYTADLKSKLGSMDINSSNWYLDSVNGSTFKFMVKSATVDKYYVNEISFTDEYDYLKKNFKFGDYDINVEDSRKELVEDIMDYFDSIVDDGDMLVYCDCPSYLYYGLKYISTQMDYEIRKRPENRAPVIRNPKEKGTVCKHLAVTLENIGNEKIKKYIVEYLTDKFLTSQVKRKYQDVKDYFWMEYFTTL